MISKMRRGEGVSCLWDHVRCSAYVTFENVKVITLRFHTSRAGPTTAFGRVVGHQAYTKICAEQLCNICCEYHYIILYTFIWFTTTVPKW